MNILFVAVLNNPFLATQGSSQRSNILLDACTRVGDVDVISFCSTSEQSSSKYTILYQEQYNCIKKEGRFAKFRKLLTPWKPNTVYSVDPYKESVIDFFLSQKRYDYIVVRYVQQAIECGLWKYANKLIIDIDDNPIDKAKNDAIQTRSIRNKAYLFLYALSLKIMLCRILRYIHIAYVSNPNDIRAKKMVYLPNVPFYSREFLSNTDKKHLKNRLIFVGDLWYWINQEGVTHFLSKIYPQVKQQIPELELHIVGRLWDNELKAKWENIDGVTVTGFVPDLIAEYDEADVAIIPIYHGAGTCIKVLEAMNLHKICITTPIGFRGYNRIFTPNEDCLIANTDKEFAEHIITALSDSEKRNKIVNNAFEKQKNYYTKDRFCKIISETIR